MSTDKILPVFLIQRLTETVSGLPDFWGEKWGLKGCNPGANSEFIPDCPPWKKRCPPCIMDKSFKSRDFFLKMSAGFLFYNPNTQTRIQNVYMPFSDLFCLGTTPHPLEILIMTDSGSLTNTAAYFDGCRSQVWKAVVDEDSVTSQTSVKPLSHLCSKACFVTYG